MNLILYGSWLGFGLPIRGAKSGGTGEPGFQKVKQPAECFWSEENKLKPLLQIFLQKIEHYDFLQYL